jgi:hypothetical protein
MLCRLLRSLLLLDLRTPPAEVVGPNLSSGLIEAALTLALSSSASPCEKTLQGDNHDGTFPDKQEGTYLGALAANISRTNGTRTSDSYIRTFCPSQSRPWP